MLSLKAFSNKEISNNALNGSKLPTSIKVLNWGANETTDGTVYLNDKTMDTFDFYQKRTGRDKDVPVDFDHASVPGSKEYVKGSPKPFAAYGNPRLVKGDGLYLDNLDWTPLGKKHAVNYKDLSPTAMVDENGTVLGLDSVALTPTGAVNNLTFYTAKSVDDFKSFLKNMNTENLKKEYDKWPGNEGIKSLDAIDGDALEEKNEIEHDEDNEDCMCAKCLTAKAKLAAYEADSEAGISMAGADAKWNEKEHKAHKALVKDFSADDDHYSKYGDVKYADSENHRYPIDTEKHIRAAWSYVNMPKNAKKLGGKLSEVKGKIAAAMKKIGAEVSETADEPKTKTMSAKTTDERPAMPNAFAGQPEYYKNMSELNSFKKMAAEVGMEGETDQEKVLYAFLSKYEGVRSENSKLINRKDNTEEGGLKQFSADVSNLRKELAELRTQRENEAKHFESIKRQALINQATKENKLIPLSADELQAVDLSILESLVSKQKSGTIPTKRIMTADAQTKLPYADKVAIFKQSIGAK